MMGKSGPFQSYYQKLQESSMENTEFSGIIQRYFRGQLKEGEHSQLAAHLKNKLNRDHFDLAKKEWELNPGDTEAGKRSWLRIQRRISRARKKIHMTSTRRLWTQIGSAAAILLFGLLLGTALSQFLPARRSFSGPLVFETPRGEKSTVTLPDGSQVWLNASSRLICQAFDSRSREVELTGEAFFKVARNENAPFRVRTSECEVEVLGTEFNVMAYENFGKKEITLVSGKINIHLQKSEQVLVPGQAFIIKDNRSWIEETNTARASAWIENRFDFQSVTLHELAKRLENWYDVDINLSNPENKNVSFTGTFKNEETIWQVLDVIRVYVPISYEKTGLREIKITVR